LENKNIRFVDGCANVSRAAGGSGGALRVRVKVFGRRQLAVRSVPVDRGAVQAVIGRRAGIA